MSEVVRRRILVEGRVQGVFFRASAEREAARLRLAGFARNLSDGRVEMMVEGPLDAVERFVAWSRLGPPRADVRGVTVEVQTPTGQRGFQAR